ncbi:MAG: hypothetical protein GZ094_12420 [Mariniphaga sp.]|nr:hypothetical protein [Mariniphaga sp.]
MKVLVIYCTAFSYLPNTKTLEDAKDITTEQTPFGYFLDLNINAPGFSLARIWASL